MQSRIMPDFIAEQLRACLPLIDKSTPGVWWVGFSGGLDSTVLLHALVQLNLPVSVRALHINHQISPHANSWQRQCEQFCQQLGVSFFAEKVQVINSGKGIEDAARAARYQVFERYVDSGDCLLTAHHGNDQAETILLRLLRGAGPRGLAAIGSARQLSSGGKLIRPLLQFSRAGLEAYACEQKLPWVEDESNQDDHYDRNFLRNQVMPLLQHRWPALIRKCQQTADLCAQQENLLDEFAKQDMEQANPRSERMGRSIDLLWLKSLSSARRQNLLRYWLRQSGCDLPEVVHLQQLEIQLFNAREDASVEIAWGEYSLRPYQTRLFLLPAVLPPMILDLVQLSAPENNSASYLRADIPNLHIRFRSGGERCKPAGRAHSQTLKKLLQEYHLEPWLRNSVPLLYSGDQLVAVGDLWICEGYVAPSGGAAVKPVWCS